MVLREQQLKDGFKIKIKKPPNKIGGFFFVFIWWNEKKYYLCKKILKYGNICVSFIINYGIGNFVY